MTSERRLFFLKIGAGAGAALWLLNLIVITPATASWHEQSDRIDVLRQKVERGRNLLERQDAIRARWAEMVRANLPKEVSAAENVIFKALGRWERDSGIVFSSLSRDQWQTHEEGYDTLECHAIATGDQVSLDRFLYELETDPAPVNLEECEISSRDAHGAELTMTARFSFLRLDVPQGGAQ